MPENYNVHYDPPRMVTLRELIEDAIATIEPNEIRRLEVTARFRDGDRKPVLIVIAGHKSEPYVKDAIDVMLALLQTADQTQPAREKGDDLQ